AFVMQQAGFEPWPRTTLVQCDLHERLLHLEEAVKAGCWHGNREESLGEALVLAIQLGEASLIEVLHLTQDGNDAQQSDHVLSLALEGVKRRLGSSQISAEAIPAAPRNAIRAGPGAAQVASGRVGDKGGESGHVAR